MRADSVSSLIVAAGERCGLLGLGFGNMKRSWLSVLGAQQGLGMAAVASRWLGGGKAKAQGRGMG